MVIENVQVGASHLVNSALLKAGGPQAVIDFNQKVEYEINIFLDRDDTMDIALFARSIADLAEPVPVVVSHLLEERNLFLYVDLVSADIHSKFIYTKHYSRMH